MNHLDPKDNPEAALVWAAVFAAVAAMALVAGRL